MNQILVEALNSTLSNLSTPVGEGNLGSHQRYNILLDRLKEHNVSPVTTVVRCRRLDSVAEKR